MLTVPIVDNTGRSVKKNVNKFKGVVANRTMEGTGRLVHMKLRFRMRSPKHENIVQILKEAGLLREQRMIRDSKHQHHQVLCPPKHAGLKERRALKGRG